MKKTLIQFMKFAIVGVSNGMVDIITYLILTRLFFPHPEFILYAKGISYLVATLWSYMANKRFTFGQREPFNLHELSVFYRTVGLGIVVNVGVTYVAVNMLHLNDIVGVFIAAGFTALWGFTFAKLYVFKK